MIGMDGIEKIGNNENENKNKSEAEIVLGSMPDFDDFRKILKKILHQNEYWRVSA